MSIKDNISSLPGEIKNEICKYLDANSLIHLSSTSKKWYETLYNGKIWKSLNLGNFVTDEILRTVQQIFKLQPKVDPNNNSLVATNNNNKALSPEDTTKKRLLSAVKVMLVGKDVSDDKWKKALEEAVQGKYTEVVEVLLQKKDPISPDAWSEAFKKVAEDAHAEVAKVMLKHRPASKRSFWGSDPIEGTLDSVFKSAMEKNQLVLAEALCKHITSSGRGEGLKSAVEKDQLEFAKVLIKSGSSDGSAALIYAAKSRREVVDFLLESGLTKRDLSLAVWSAVYHDQFEPAEVLLSYGQIDDYWLGSAVTSALEKGQFALVETLLKHGPINPKYWCEALEKAVEDKQIAIIETLFKYSPELDHEIESTLDKLVKPVMKEQSELFRVLLMHPSGYSRSTALKFALEMGESELAETLLKSGPINHLKGKILISAAKHYPDFVKVLLGSGLTNGDLSQAVWLAVYHDQFETAEVLLSYGQIDEYWLGSTVESAVEKGKFALVETLLKKGPIHSEHWCKALEKLVEKENAITTKLLLEHRPRKESWRGAQIEPTLDKLFASLMKKKKFEFAAILLPQVSNRCRSDALKSIIEDGQSTILKTLLQGGPIPAQCWREMLEKMVEDRHAEMAAILFENRPISDDQPTQSKDALERVFKVAVDKRQLILVEALNKFILESDQIKALQSAAEKDQFENVKTLLQFNHIQDPDLLKAVQLKLDNHNKEEDRWLALESAVKEGRLDGAKVLLQSGPISEQRLHQAIQSAGEKNYKGIVNLAMEVAEIRGDLQIIQALLKYSQIETDYLLNNAAENGYEKVMAFLLKKLSVQNVIRGMAVNSAASKGFTKIVELLLKSGSISEDDRGRAVQNAADKGFQEIIELLLNNGSISDKDRGLAVCYAAAKGFKEVVGFLFNNGSISEKDRGCAVWYAAAKDFKEVIELLLNNGSISDKDRVSAVCRAANEGFIEVAKLLLKRGALSEMDYDQALKSVICAKQPQPEIVRALLQNGSISDKSLGEAKTLANGIGETEIGAILDQEELRRNDWSGVAKVVSAVAIVFLGGYFLGK